MKTKGNEQWDKFKHVASSLIAGLLRGAGEGALEEGRVGGRCPECLLNFNEQNIAMHTLLNCHFL